MIREFAITHEYAGTLIAWYEKTHEGLYRVWLRDHVGFIVMAASIGAAEQAITILLDIKFNRMFMCLTDPE